MTPVQKRLETLEKQVKALTTAMNNLTPKISTMAKLVEFLDKELTDEQKKCHHLRNFHQQGKYLIGVDKPQSLNVSGKSGTKP